LLVVHLTQPTKRLNKVPYKVSDCPCDYMKGQVLQARYDRRADGVYHVLKTGVLALTDGLETTRFPPVAMMSGDEGRVYAFTFDQILLRGLALLEAYPAKPRPSSPPSH
jgi:hypothetical protein